MKTVLNDRAAAPQVNRSSIYGDFISGEGGNKAIWSKF